MPVYSFTVYNQAFIATKKGSKPLTASKLIAYPNLILYLNPPHLLRLQSVRTYTQVARKALQDDARSGLNGQVHGGGDGCQTDEKTY